MKHASFSSILAVSSLLFIFILSIILVNPFGNFPLDDDFAYGKTVKNLMETGRLQIHPWISATVIAQTFIGMIFSIPFGFSFDALRFSSLFFAFVGAVAFFFILRNLSLTTRISFIGAFALLFNPLYFSKAFNFHSDIHFMAFFLLSILFYLMAFNKKGNSLFFLAGSVSSIFAILVRQNGVLIPISVVAFLWLSRKYLNLKNFAIIAVLPFISFAAYSYWFYFIHGITESGSLMLEYASRFRELVFILIPFKLFAMFIYLGLFSLPFTISQIICIAPFLRSLARIDKIIFFSSIAAGFCSIAFMFFSYGKLLFYLPTMIHSSGIGPVYLQGLKNPTFPMFIIIAMAALSVFSGSILLVTIRSFLARNFSRTFSSSPEFFVYLAGFFQFLFLVVLLVVFDRYLIPLLLPLYAYILLRMNKLFSSKLALFALVLIALFSVAGTQDYLSWNRARYNAISDLQSQGIPNDKIDGGFEYGAWNFYEYSKAHPEIKKSKPYDPGWIRDYFPVIDSEYVVSFSPLQGYSPVKEYKYFSMLTLKNEKIYALKRF